MRHTPQFIAVEKPALDIPSVAFATASLQFLATAVFKATLFALVISLVYTEVVSFHKSLPVAAKIDKQLTLEERQAQDVAQTFKLLWGHAASTSVTEGVLLGTKSIRTAVVDPVLVAVLLDTESKGKLNARSSKNYVGLMQTPSMTGIPEADIMHGCKKLDQKLAWKSVNPNKDLRVALALYKGGLSGTAFNQADEVLRKYKKIRQQLSR